MGGVGFSIGELAAVPFQAIQSSRGILTAGGNTESTHTGVIGQVPGVC